MLSHNKTVLSAIVAVCALALQSTVIAFSTSELAVRAVLPATIVFVALAIWPHRRLAGAWIMYVGLSANLAVIIANGGLMPIERSTVVEAIGADEAAEYRTGDRLDGSKDVLVASGAGRAAALGDSIVIRTTHGGFAASPGDIVIWAGLVALVAEASWAWRRSARRSARATHTRDGVPIAAVAEHARAAGSTPTPH